MHDFVFWATLGLAISAFILIMLYTCNLDSKNRKFVQSVVELLESPHVNRLYKLGYTATGNYRRRQVCLFELSDQVVKIVMECSLDRNLEELASKLNLGIDRVRWQPQTELHSVECPSGIWLTILMQDWYPGEPPEALPILEALYAACAGAEGSYV
jgi:hypothetical protein